MLSLPLPPQQRHPDQSPFPKRRIKNILPFGRFKLTVMVDQLKDLPKPFDLRHEKSTQQVQHNRYGRLKMDWTYQRLEQEYNKLLQAHNKLLDSSSVLRKFVYASAFIAMCGGGALGLCIYYWLSGRRKPGKDGQSASRRSGDGLGGVELQPLTSPRRAAVRGEEERGRLPRYRSRDAAPRYSVTDPNTERPQTPWSIV